MLVHFYLSTAKELQKNGKDGLHLIIYKALNFNALQKRMVYNF